MTRSGSRRRGSVRRRFASRPPSKLVPDKGADEGASGSFLDNFPAGSRNHGADARRRRRASLAEAAFGHSRPRKKILPQQNWRSQMNTMTINGRVEPLPDDPHALLVD